MKRDQVAGEQESGLLAGWARFWFTPTDPFALNLLRVLTGAILIVWLASLANDVNAFFGLQGIFDHRAYLEASRLPGEAPKPISWSLVFLFGRSPQALQAFHAVALVVLLLFTVGIFPRITSILTWLVVVSFTANPAFDDEVEVLLQVLTLYLAFGYLLPARWQEASWLERILGPWRVFPLPRGNTQTPPSLGANIAVRLLQVHLTILFVTSGLHKLQAGEWWAGLPHWYKLHMPFDVTAASMRSLAPSAGSYLGTLSVLAYATLAWQIGLPLFAWRTGLWRIVLLGGAVAGWIGLQTIYRQPLFGPVVVIGCLSYISAAEWQFLRDLIRGIAQRNGIGVERTEVIRNIPARQQPAGAVALRGR
jgi:hypothetical protein